MSPDEDSEEQITSICAAVWAARVDGVVVGKSTVEAVVLYSFGAQFFTNDNKENNGALLKFDMLSGNTTKSRPDPLSKELTKAEATAMKERGGYSGPQLFSKTLSLVKRYRRILDYPLQEENGLSQTHIQSLKAPESSIEASRKRDEHNLKDASLESSDQPLIRLPERLSSSATDSTRVKDAPVLSASHHLEQQSAPTPSKKVIFCTVSTLLSTDFPIKQFWF